MTAERTAVHHQRDVRPEVRAALYARVSTVDKDQNPETQLRILREHATARGWTVAVEDRG